MASSGLAAFAPLGALAAVTPGYSENAEPAAQFLALFPLGIVAFPGERLLLHIFEPRYRQLIAECAENGIRFGIVTIVPGGASSIGTEMELDRILRSDDSGTMDVAIRGIRAFRLRSFQPAVEGKLYSGGLVSYIKNDGRIEPETESALVQLYNRRRYRSGSRQQLAAPYPENLSFFIGHDLGLSSAQELQLLTLPIEHDRQSYLFQHLLRMQ